MILFSSPTGPSVGAYAIRPYNRVRVILRNTDAIPQLGTCCPSKNYPVFVLFGAVCGAYAIRPYDRVRARIQKMDLYTPPSVAYGGAYAIRSYDWVRVILQNTDAIPQLDTCCSSKNCLVSVPLGAVGWGVFNTPLRPGTCDSSKYRCNSPTGCVRPFKKLSRFHPLRGRLWSVCDTPLRPGTCCLSKKCPVFVPFGTACGAYAIRPYNRVRAILRNTDAILQLGTCGPSKNCLISVPLGAVCGAYAIRPYDRVCVALQKTVSFSSPSGPSVGRMQYAPQTGYVWPFKKLSRFRPLRGRGVGRIQYAPTTGYVRSFEIPMQFSNWVCAILRNTDAIPQPDTCDPSKYRYDLSTGGAGIFGRWGGGGYRLRGRWA